MDTIEKMLDAAMDGSFSESTFDESKLSALETKFAHYLSAAETSSRNVAQEKDRIKSLIADISHQTKTPIANLLLYSELLMEENGQDIFSLKDEALTIFRRRKIGFVFQAYNLVPVLNVYENIVLPIELDGGKINKEFVQQIVQTLGLDERLNALPNQLSGGQQQRVAIARALAAAPAIILADEPTGNLDSKTSQDVLSLLKVTSQKFAQTIVMITHNEEIAQMADRIIRIEDGRIVSQN